MSSDNGPTVKVTYTLRVTEDIVQAALRAADNVQPRGTYTSLFDDAADASPAETQKALGKFEQAMQGTDAPVKGAPKL